MRICNEYMDCIIKPGFEISINYIKIILPVKEMNKLNLLEEEIIIYNIMKDEIEISRAELDKKSGFDKSKTLRILNKLIDKNMVQKLGKGPGTTYRLR